MLTSAFVLLVALSGCLLPPDVQYVPEPENQPPRIDPSQVSPPPAEGPRTQVRGCTYSYRAVASDPDGTDTLYWRIFLDYYRDRFQEPESGEAPVRTGDVAIEFSVDADDLRFGPLSAQSEPHVVELLVSDRQFIDTDVAPVRRAVPDGALTDSVLWTVSLQQQGSPCE